MQRTAAHLRAIQVWSLQEDPTRAIGNAQSVAAHAFAMCLVLVVLATSVSCSGAGGNTNASTPAPITARVPETVDALCRAAAASSGGDNESARRLFTDIAHDALHRLALETQPIDSPAAGRLLIAKNRVEVVLARDGGPNTEELRAALDQLITSTRDAGDVVGRTAPACGA